MIYRIEQDFYTLVKNIECEENVEQARTELKNQLLKLVPAFKEMPFFLSQDFSLVDCTLAALLWRLPSLGIELPEVAEEITAYSERLFSRESFKTSLSEQERELRDDYHDI